MLKSFGERRVTRTLTQKNLEGRISVGLGSVIMKAIVQVHRGEVEVSNILDDLTKKNIGSSLEIKLPT